jgi:hypothetical protein
VILARVQGHPSRTALHERLLPLLEPFPTEVLLHESDPPDPWAGYRQCLTNIPDECSHLLVVQDDAIPAPGFPDAVRKITDRHPDTPVCLFMGSLPSATAAVVRRQKPDVRYVTLAPASFMPLVCVLWPTQAARRFLQWAATSRKVTRADDGNAGRWVRTTRQHVLVAVPSLVEHDDYVPSVKGGRVHKPGMESWRRALMVAADAADYDW